MKSINISLGKMTQTKKVTAVLSWTEGVSTTTSSSDSVAASAKHQQRDPGEEDGTQKSEWDVPREQFMTRFCDSASESLCNAYATHHPLHHSSLSGIIASTLCEDVFTLVNMQWNVIHDYLKETKTLGTDLGNTVLVDGLLCIFSNLEQKHVQYRDTFLTDLECSCATANDFWRMSETTEEFWTTLCRTYPTVLDGGDTENDDKKCRSKTTTMKTSTTTTLKEQVNDLLSLYSSDAVYAAQRAHTFVVRAIHQSDIPTQLFSREWEDVYTSNEVVLSLIKTMEDFLYDFHNFFCNDLLYRKLVDSLVRAMVCFYISSLVRKADRGHRGLAAAARKNQHPRASFSNPSRAIFRMMYDVELFRTYFESLTKECPSLANVVEEELSILVLVHECLALAVGGLSASTLEEFVIVVHKRTGGNVGVTRHFMGDLWLLAAAPPSQRNEVFNTINLMQFDLQLISMHMNENRVNVHPNERDPLKGIKLAETLQDLYEERMLQEQFSVCAPCVHAIKKAQRNGARKALSPEKVPLKLEMPLISFRHNDKGQSEQTARNLQEKLSEVLKLQNLNFVKKRPAPVFQFKLSTTIS